MFLKNKKTVLATIITASTLATGINGAAYAAIVPGVSLNAQATVDEFNMANGGVGYVFDVCARFNGGGLSYEGKAGGLVLLKTHDDYDVIDTRAYAEQFDEGHEFATIQLGKTTPRISESEHFEGDFINGTMEILHYNGIARTTCTSDGTALNVGAACLYKLLATTEPSGLPGGFNDLNGLEYIAGAIRFLMDGVTIINVDREEIDYDEVTVDWGSNFYLQMLLGINENQSYWESAYDPGAYYEEIRNYSVFVMQANFEDYPETFDFLYIIPVSSTIVPEPASLSCLGLGAVALMMRRRK